MNKMYEEIFSKVAEELEIPVDVVELAYRLKWKFIRNKIEQLPLKEDIDQEGFSKLRTNFNLPSLGKLFTTFDKVEKAKRRFEYVKNLKENE